MAIGKSAVVDVFFFIIISFLLQYLSFHVVFTSQRAPEISPTYTVKFMKIFISSAHSVIHVENCNDSDQLDYLGHRFSLLVEKT